MMIKTSKNFIKASQLYKNAGHFTSYRYCCDTYHNCEIFIIINRLVIIYYHPALIIIQYRSTVYRDHGG